MKIDPKIILVGLAGVAGLAWFMTQQHAGATRRRGQLAVLLHSATSTTTRYAGGIVRITMVDGYENVDRTGITDITGYTYFDDIPEGQYHVQITLTGFKPWDTVQAVLFNADGTTQHGFGMAPL